MPLFGRRKQEPGEPPARSFAADADAMRAALSARQADSGARSGAVDPRAIVSDLLEGEMRAPTADVAALIRARVDPAEFYEREVAPSWERLGESQRAARVDGFLDLCRMLDESGGSVDEEMRAAVHTKTLILAWAFDETYGYLAQIARGESQGPPG